jgi:hypothetical protein
LRNIKLREKGKRYFASISVKRSYRDPEDGQQYVSSYFAVAGNTD